MKKNENGTLHLVVIVLVVVVTVIAGVGFMVMKQNKSKKTDASQSTQTTDAAQTSEPTASDSNLATYTDDVGKFTVQYPKTWSITTKKGEQGGPDAPTRYTTIKDPSGYTVELNVDYGGKGGMCEPAATDKPFQTGNMCPTDQTISLEKTGAKVYSSYQREPDARGQISFDYKLTDVYLMHTKFADPDGKLQYTSCLTEMHDADINDAKTPRMGLYIAKSWITHYGPGGPSDSFFYVYPCIQETGDSEAFFDTPEVKRAEEVLKSLRFSDGQ